MSLISELTEQLRSEAEWQQSRRANQEYGYALAKGYKVMEE